MTRETDGSRADRSSSSATRGASASARRERSSASASTSGAAATRRSARAPASAMRVRRVAVSVLEAASSVSTAPTRRTGRGATPVLVPETPAGMPKRKARLQQTPSRRSARKASVVDGVIAQTGAGAVAIATAVAHRTPAEIRASFEQLVASTAAQRINNDNVITSQVDRRRRHGHSADATMNSSTSSSSNDSSCDNSSNDSSKRITALSHPHEHTRKRKRKQPAQDELSTVARTSKRLRAQSLRSSSNKLSALLPPAHVSLAPVGGNTAEDEELLQIQKRLVFSSRRVKPRSESRSEVRGESKAESRRDTNRQSNVRRTTAAVAASDSASTADDGDDNDDSDGSDGSDGSSSKSDDATADNGTNSNGNSSSDAAVRRRIAFATRQQQQQQQQVSPVARSSPRERSDPRELRPATSFVSILEDVDALPRAKCTGSTTTKTSKTKTSKTSKPDKSDTSKRPTKAVKAAAGRPRKSMHPSHPSLRSSTKTSTALMLTNWTLQWPLASTFTLPSAALDDHKSQPQLQVVFEGCVDGDSSATRRAVTVARRVSALQFVSTAGERVTLVGRFDVARARANGVSSAVIALVSDGLPTHWRRKLEAATATATTSANVLTKAKRRTETASASASSESEPENEDVPVTLQRRSRSGRTLTPVMDWWRNERLTTDAHGKTVVNPGSPARLIASERKQTAVAIKTKARAKPRALTPSVAQSTVATRAPPSAAKPPRVPAKTPSRTKTASGITADTIGTTTGTTAGTITDSEWTDAQLQALAAAKLQIATTAPNFWADVASLVPGKSARACRSKSFEAFATPPSRTSRKRTAVTTGVGSTSAAAATALTIPQKLHRAGSNLFKKQVRAFVTQYEAKHADDVFGDTTPSKAELASGLDDMQSPLAPLGDVGGIGGYSHSDGSDDDDDVLGGSRRELLSTIAPSKRDEVDSYVLSLKRRHVLGGISSSSGSSNARVQTSLVTPSTLKRKSKATKRTVLLYESVGTHRVEGVVSPGGTARVRVDKDSDATTDDDDDVRDSDGERSSNDGDAFF